MLDKLNATEMVRRFDEYRSVIASGQDKRWRWAPGTLLFPEGRCCYCGEAVRSNRIWRVDSGGSWLKGQLDVRGKVAAFERPNHPHAGTDGSLCTGGHDVLTALFFGINPADPIMRAMDIPTWYADLFDHKCGEGGLTAATGLFVARTAVHGARRAVIICPCACRCDPARGACPCGCEACVCTAAWTCPSCEGRISREEEWRYGPDEAARWCGECWNESWVECYTCGILLDRNDMAEEQTIERRSYCNDCLPSEEIEEPADVTAGTLTATVTAVER